MSSQEMKNEKLLILAFPSVGLVGAFATSYLVNQLKMKDIGELEFTKFSPSYLIKDGKIYGPNRIYKKENTYAILVGFPLNPVLAYDLVVKSIEYAKNNGISKIIIPRGLEVGENYNKDPISYGLSVNKNSDTLFGDYNLPTVPSATILGADASIMSALKNSKFPCIVLYTTCRMMMPDDDAIIRSIKTMADIIKVKVDTEKFEEELEKISKENEKLIQQTKKFFENSSGRPASMPQPGVA
ncbi:MAG: PAC2 family protein [Nitrosopumilaceae archaeon]|jgi:predicted ATP-grasp superfamily ATP-dependent carboligase